MKLHRIVDGVATEHPIDELEAALADREGYLWLDMPAVDDEARRVLEDVFGFDHRAVRDCIERSHIPKVYPHEGYLFLALQGLEPGGRGHVHLLELDQFVGANYLVTVHGPFGRDVDPQLGLRETDAVWERISKGGAPATPAELSALVTSTMTRRLEVYLHDLARQIAGLEQRAREEDHHGVEFLGELFSLQHQLVTLKNRAGQTSAAARSMVASAAEAGLPAGPYEPLIDRFDRLHDMCEGEADFVRGVLDFYQSRTNMKMNIAMERLALIAAVTIPITAIGSVYGMNIIGRGTFDPLQLVIVLVVMLVCVVALFRWAKAQGWW